MRYKLWTPEEQIVPNAMCPDMDGEWIRWEDLEKAFHHAKPRAMAELKDEAGPLLTITCFCKNVRQVLTIDHTKL